MIIKNGSIYPYTESSSTAQGIIVSNGSLLDEFHFESTPRVTGKLSIELNIQALTVKEQTQEILLAADTKSINIKGETQEVPVELETQALEIER